jgi:hypothetical protein
MTTLMRSALSQLHFFISPCLVSIVLLDAADVHTSKDICDPCAKSRPRLSRKFVVHSHHTAHKHLPSPAHAVKVRPAVFAMAHRHRANTATSTLSSTYQENNMQKNTTSLWAGSTVAGLFV